MLLPQIIIGTLNSNPNINLAESDDTNFCNQNVNFTSMGYEEFGNVGFTTIFNNSES